MHPGSLSRRFGMLGMSRSRRLHCMLAGTMYHAMSCTARRLAICNLHVACWGELSHSAPLRRIVTGLLYLSCMLEVHTACWAHAVSRYTSGKCAFCGRPGLTCCGAQGPCQGHCQGAPSGSILLLLFQIHCPESRHPCVSDVSASTCAASRASRGQRLWRPHLSLPKRQRWSMVPSQQQLPRALEVRQSGSTARSGCLSLAAPEHLHAGPVFCLFLRAAVLGTAMSHSGRLTIATRDSFCADGGAAQWEASLKQFLKSNGGSSKLSVLGTNCKRPDSVPKTQKLKSFLQSHGDAFEIDADAGTVRLK